MNIGCVKEIMRDESRVGLRPANMGAKELSRWVAVRMEECAGKKSGFPDEEYERAGAMVLPQEDVWRNSNLIIKVKQPLEEEFKLLRENSILFCFPHFADNIPFLDVAIEKRITTIAYETIRLENGYNPILAEMSKIAGRKTFLDCADLLMKKSGRMPWPNSKILILGLGNAGISAAELAVGTESARPKLLYLLDKNPGKFTPLKAYFYQRLGISPYKICFIKYDQESSIDQQILRWILTDVDLLIAATYVDGELQAKAIPEWMEGGMKLGSVTADISIDQGGALESSYYYKKTGQQVFKKNGIWHYCVPNIPGKVPVDSTPALTRETFPYIAELAQKGLERAVRENPALRRGVNTHKGWITHEGLAKSIGRMKNYRPLMEVL